jgi:hypothetical protein
MVKVLPIRAAVLLALVISLVVPIMGEAAACAPGPGAVHLVNFVGQPDAGSFFYAAQEGGAATATIHVVPGDCMGPRAQGQFATVNGSATAPGDYEPQGGWTPFICDDAHPDFCGGTPPTYPVQIPMKDDDAPGEAAVESLTFTLIGGTMGVDPPSSAPVYIIDTDGAPRAALESGTAYSRSETFARIKIPVFFAGTSVAPVGYTLTPDPSAPANPEEDFKLISPNPLTPSVGRVGFIELEIVNDKIGEPPESVVIDLSGDGSTTFTIEDNEESSPPTSRLHHPRHKWRYSKSDYRIREVHIFAHDNPGGAGVTGAQLALRRNIKNGDCAWLTKKGWQKQDCSNREWLDGRYDQTGDLWRIRLTQLKSSVNTRIKNYTAFSRAIDGAGNAEREFKEKRNANTFEVKRSRRRR